MSLLSYDSRQTESISQPEGLLDTIEVPFTLEWDQWLS